MRAAVYQWIQGLCKKLDIEIQGTQTLGDKDADRSHRVAVQKTVEVETKAGCGSCKKATTSMDRVKWLRFSESMSWVVFHH
jgi:hypothetical protein